MPTFVKRDVVTARHGFWQGDEVTQTVDCTTAQQTAINAAFTALMANPGLNCVPGLKACMQGKVATIPVDCCVNGAIPDHGGIQSLINICTTDATSMQAEIAKGLVRSCGGHRLDVVVLQEVRPPAPRTAALVLLPHDPLRLGCDVRRIRARSCRMRPVGEREAALVQLRKREVQHPVQDLLHVAVGNHVAQQRRRVTQLLACRARELGDEPDPLFVGRVVGRALLGSGFR